MAIFVPQNSDKLQCIDIALTYHSKKIPHRNAVSSNSLSAMLAQRCLDRFTFSQQKYVEMYREMERSIFTEEAKVRFTKRLKLTGVSENTRVLLFSK